MTRISQPENEQNNVRERYTPIFRRYLAGALQQSLQHVTAHRYTVPEDVRAQAWHILRLTMDVDELWEQTSQLLIELAPRMEMAGFRQDWIPFLEAGIARSERLADRVSHAEFIYYLGQLYRMQGLTIEASTFLSRSVDIFADLNLQNYQARVLNEQAFVSWSQGDYETTKTLAEKALQLLDKKDPECAMSYYHLGQISMVHGDLNKAETHFRAAMEIRQGSNDPRRAAWGYNNVGRVLLRQNRFSEASSYFENAIEQQAYLGDVAQRALTLNNLGNLNEAIGNYADAMTNYEEARSIFHSLSDRLNLSHVLNNQGVVYNRLEKWHDAIDALSMSISIRETLGIPVYLAGSLDSLGEAYLGLKEFKKAIEIFEQAMALLNDVSPQVAKEVRRMLEAHIDEALIQSRDHV